MTTTPRSDSRLSVVVGPSSRSVFVGALRAEWTKIRTVRSTVWSLLVTCALTIGLGALFCAARVARWDRIEARDRFDATGFSLNGLFLAQFAIGVLGVLVMSSEYATGQIRATLTATPQRVVVLGAKLVVFCILAFVVGLVACLPAYLIGQAILSQKHAGTSLHDPTAVRAVIGAAMYLSVLGALGVGLGTILRRTAGAIASLVVLVLILPILVAFLPSPWNDDIGRYLPVQAGTAIFRSFRDSNNLGPWTGFIVFSGYAVAALVLGAVLLNRRDA